MQPQLVLLQKTLLYVEGVGRSFIRSSIYGKQRSLSWSRGLRSGRYSCAGESI